VIVRNCLHFQLIFICLASTLVAADLGTITIPRDGVLGGRPVQAGVYKIEIDETAEQPYLRLIKNEKMVATDLAILLPARGPGKTSVQVVKIAEKEFIRIRARYGDRWYFAYLSVATNLPATKS
jgi:hypothetical protein